MYLVENGWNKFITWYDYESWYPIGRPVGKSIYPGMQVAAAVIHWFLGAIGYPLSLNDVCVPPNPCLSRLSTHGLTQLRLRPRLLLSPHLLVPLRHG
jgi:hypothetical protein